MHQFWKIKTSIFNLPGEILNQWHWDLLHKYLIFLGSWVGKFWGVYFIPFPLFPYRVRLQAPVVAAGSVTLLLFAICTFSYTPGSLESSFLCLKWAVTSYPGVFMILSITWNDLPFTQARPDSSCHLILKFHLLF